jgi:hypothetical protein
MAPPVRLALGQAQTGWLPHRARLQAFGQECEALVQGAIAFQLTDDAYIGQACFRLLGDIRRLDAAVFAQWVAACPWECAFVPTHAGYPCLFVSPGVPRPPPPGMRCRRCKGGVCDVSRNRGFGVGSDANRTALGAGVLPRAGRAPCGGGAGGGLGWVSCRAHTRPGGGGTPRASALKQRWTGPEERPATMHTHTEDQVYKQMHKATEAAIHSCGETVEALVGNGPLCFPNNAAAGNGETEMITSPHILLQDWMSTMGELENTVGCSKKGLSIVVEGKEKGEMKVKVLGRLVNPTLLEMGNQQKIGITSDHKAMRADPSGVGQIPSNYPRFATPSQTHRQATIVPVEEACCDCH